MKRRLSKTHIALAVVLTLSFTVIAVTATLYIIRRAPVEIVLHAETSLPELYPIADFQLTDSTGATFGLEDLRDTMWVANFMFTSCPSICPTLSANMATLQNQFANNPDVEFVSVTVDPETDTPEVMAEYAARFNANPERWHFLSGPVEDIHTLAVESFKVGSVDNPVFHSDKFILVDRAGYIRGYYTGTDTADVQRLADDIELLHDRRSTRANPPQGTDVAIKVFE